MPTPVRDKYYLRSLHEEIALFDRKLAHLLRFETFPSEKERNAAAAKMSVKRGQLVQTARLLAESGIEFQPATKPLSMQPEQPSVATDEAIVEPVSVVRSNTAVAAKRTSATTFHAEIQDYLASRKRTRRAPTAS